MLHGRVIDQSSFPPAHLTQDYWPPKVSGSAVVSLRLWAPAEGFSQRCGGSESPGAPSLALAIQLRCLSWGQSYGFFTCPSNTLKSVETVITQGPRVAAPSVANPCWYPLSIHVRIRTLLGSNPWSFSHNAQFCDFWGHLQQCPIWSLSGVPVPVGDEESTSNRLLMNNLVYSMSSKH